MPRWWFNENLPDPAPGLDPGAPDDAAPRGGPWKMIVHRRRAKTALYERLLDLSRDVAGMADTVTAWEDGAAFDDGEPPLGPRLARVAADLEELSRG